MSRYSLLAMCATKIDLTTNFAAIGCSSYSQNNGRVIIFYRNSTYQLVELIAFDGDKNNFLLGEDI
jgi:hypothetical protein